MRTTRHLLTALIVAVSLWTASGCARRVESPPSGDQVIRDPVPPAPAGPEEGTTEPPPEVEEPAPTISLGQEPGPLELLTENGVYDMTAYVASLEATDGAGSPVTRFGVIPGEGLKVKGFNYGVPTWKLYPEEPSGSDRSVTLLLLGDDGSTLIHEVNVLAPVRFALVEPKKGHIVYSDGPHRASGTAPRGAQVELTVICPDGRPWPEDYATADSAGNWTGSYRIGDNGDNGFARGYCYTLVATCGADRRTVCVTRLR
jgi:hypothetical protein